MKWSCRTDTANIWGMQFALICPPSNFEECSRLKSWQQLTDQLHKPLPSAVAANGAAYINQLSDRQPITELSSLQSGMPLNKLMHAHISRTHTQTHTHHLIQAPLRAAGRSLPMFMVSLNLQITVVTAGQIYDHGLSASPGTNRGSCAQTDVPSLEGRILHQKFFAADHR